MKILKTLAVAIVVLLAAAAVAYGADQIRDRGTQPQRDKSPDKVKLQKQLRNGSCRDVANQCPRKVKDPTDRPAKPSRTCDRDRDQLRDGSCGVHDGDRRCTQTRQGTQTRECTQTRQGTQTRTQPHQDSGQRGGGGGHHGGGGQHDGGGHHGSGEHHGGDH